MCREHAAKRRPPDFTWFFLAQGLLSLLLTLIGAMWSGFDGAWSALTGGLVSVLPSLYFVQRGFRGRRNGRARSSVFDLYQAAMGKFGLTVALFAVVFVAAPPSNPALFFGAFVAAQLMHWLTPWLLRERSSPRT